MQNFIVLCFVFICVKGSLGKLFPLENGSIFGSKEGENDEVSFPLSNLNFIICYSLYFSMCSRVVCGLNCGSPGWLKM